MSFSKCNFCFMIQLVQEYERAVIFRLGRIIDRKPKGPGIRAPPANINENLHNLVRMSEFLIPK